jgi:anti-anti-sigma factor
MTAQLWISASEAPAGVLRLRVVGEIDLATVDVLDERLRWACADAQWLILDLRATRFLACAGLRVLHAAAQRCDRLNVGFEVWATARPVRLPIQRTGLDGALRLGSGPAPYAGARQLPTQRGTGPTSAQDVWLDASRGSLGDSGRSPGHTETRGSAG